MLANKVLLLTDAVDSTSLTEALGDEEASALWAEHDRRARRLLRVWRGIEIDRSDGFLLVFENVDDAAGFAQALHGALAGLSPPIKARAGIHLAPMMQREATLEERALGAKSLELDGLGKSVAARVMALASGGQTLLTDAAQSALVGEAWRIRLHGYWQLKGVAEPMAVWEMADPSGSFFGPPNDGPKAYRVIRFDDGWTPASEIRHGLPAERDAFVGRVDQLTALVERFDRGARLVTLLGMGGMGKTRLALRYGRQWLGEYPGGAWFCDLSSASSLDGIVHAVGQGLDVPLGKTDPVQQLGAAIHGRGACLVILDNFEQVTGLAGATLGQWLDRAPRARFAVTSREVLGIPGEVSLQVPPLPLDEAVDLFARRARSADERSLAAADEKDVLPQLVDMLDRMPLAIELAAARIRVMGPRAMLQRVRERFELLASTKGRYARQATLRATLDWSWELLDDAEQSALAQLSVFEGGFTLEAAEAVVRPHQASALRVADLIQSLVEKSLVRADDRYRFGLLRSVQDYAAEQLQRRIGDHALAQAGHWQHYAQLTETQATAHGCADIENCAAACRRAARIDATAAVRALQVAWHGLRLTGPFRTVLGLVDVFDEQPTLDSAQRCVIDRVAGEALLLLGDITPAQSRLEAALEGAVTANSKADETLALCAMAHAWIQLGQSAQAEEALGRARELAQRLGRDDLRLRSLSGMGALHLARSRLEEALAVYEESMRLALTQGDRRRIGGLHGTFGLIAQLRGQREQARGHYEAAITLAQDVGDRQWEGNTRCNLGLLMHELGDDIGARAQLATALLIARSIGHRRLEAMAQCNLGLVVESSENAARALPHFEAAVQIMRSVNDRRQLGQLLGYLGLALARADRLTESALAFADAELLLQSVDDPQTLALFSCQRSIASSQAGQAAEVAHWLAKAEALISQSPPADGSELQAALTEARAAVNRY